TLALVDTPLESVRARLDACLVQGELPSGAEGRVVAGPPSFVDPAGPDAVLATLDDDFRLASGSPAIDAGDSTALAPDWADLNADGDVREPRPVDLAGNE